MQFWLNVITVMHLNHSTGIYPIPATAEDVLGFLPYTCNGTDTLGFPPYPSTDPNTSYRGSNGGMSCPVLELIHVSKCLKPPQEVLYHYVKSETSPGRSFTIMPNLVKTDVNV
jgi:hypothetical protein